MPSSSETRLRGRLREGERQMIVNKNGRGWYDVSLRRGWWVVGLRRPRSLFWSPDGTLRHPGARRVFGCRRAYPDA